MSVNESYLPMLLLTVNNSIGDISKHFTSKKLIELFNKKSNTFNDLDKYAVETIQTEATKQEIANFKKLYNINSEKINYLLSCNPY